MRTNEEYYDSVLLNRKLVTDPQVMKCTCPNTLCEYKENAGNASLYIGIITTTFPFAFKQSSEKK